MVARMPVPGPVVQPHSYKGKCRPLNSGTRLKKENIEDQSRRECAEIMDDWRWWDRGAIRSYAQFQSARLTMQAKIGLSLSLANDLVE
jgi:hypothetical protein